MQVETIQSEFKPKSCQNHCAKEDALILKLHNALRDSLEKRGFVKYSIRVTQINTNGGNYLGELYEVDVKETSNGAKSINIFLKKAIKGDKMVLLPVNQAHNREVFFYKDISRVFTELQNEAGIPIKERFRVVKSYDVNEPDFLILENLAKKGYKTYDRMDIVSLQYAEMCIEQLAKFHALSFVMEQKRPEYFKANITTKTHLYTFDHEDSWDIFFSKLCKSALKCLEGRNKEGLEKYMPNIKERFKELILDTDNYRSCLCHGDWRPNNIMMTETNGVMTDIIGIDYQLIYYGNPINDFLFFIFSSSDQTFRKLHMEYLKDFYYDQMATFLKRFGLNAENLYSRRIFEKNYKERLDHGLISFLILAPFLFAPDDDIPDFEKNLDAINFAISDDCKQRVSEVIEDFVKWRIL